ncbi:hypothetical protein [Rhizobium vallis]|uniref:hypothetical protein n=1 Tax=Rhizobium vallis TaxID=634290 RepID=UPI0013E0E49A|nr:hypothetical protein [Rhizobium vallis]
MIMFYHTPQKAEYHFVHCSNASSARLRVNFTTALPFLLAKINETSLGPWKAHRFIG